MADRVGFLPETVQRELERRVGKAAYLGILCKEYRSLEELLEQCDMASKSYGRHEGLINI